MKPLRFTRHARNRIRRDQVLRNTVASAIEHPDFLLPNKEGRLEAVKRLGKEHLRIIFKEESRYIVVITVILRKRRFYR